MPCWMSLTSFSVFRLQCLRSALSFWNCRHGDPGVYPSVGLLLLLLTFLEHLILTPLLLTCSLVLPRVWAWLSHTSALILQPNSGLFSYTSYVIQKCSTHMVASWKKSAIATSWFCCSIWSLWHLITPSLETPPKPMPIGKDCRWCHRCHCASLRLPQLPPPPAPLPSRIRPPVSPTPTEWSRGGQGKSLFKSESLQQSCFKKISFSCEYSGFFLVESPASVYLTVTHCFWEKAKSCHLLPVLSARYRTPLFLRH